MDRYQDVWKFRRNTWEFDVIALDENYIPINLTGATIHFGVKRDINDVTYVFRHDDIWRASTGYILTRFIVPRVNNNRAYECTTAGTSGVTEPVWGTVIGGTTTDGTVVWTCRLIRVKIVTDIPSGKISIAVSATFMDIAPETYYWDVKAFFPVPNEPPREYTLKMGRLIIEEVVNPTSV